jgi:hypothetical protein
VGLTFFSAAEEAFLYAASVLGPDLLICVSFKLAVQIW